MDLSTLTKLSRDQLEAYARRAGVSAPERFSNTELLATLVNQQLADADRLMQRARDSQVAKTARGMLSTLVQSSLRRFNKPDALPKSEPSATPAVARPAPAPVAPVKVVEPVVAAAPVEQAPVVQAPVVQAPIEHAPAVQIVQAPTFEAQPIVDDGVPTRRFVEEPIRTRSMARLLAAQGHRDRAVAILESIVQSSIEDMAARDDLERLRSDLPLDAELSRLPEPNTPPALPDTGDAIELRALPSRELHLSWTTTDAGKARANAVLGTDGELALRVVAITPDPTRVVRSEITERAPVEASHEWTAPAIAPGSRCFAAIGMRAGGRFVAIAHAPARTID